MTAQFRCTCDARMIFPTWLKPRTSKSS